MIGIVPVHYLGELVTLAFVDGADYESVRTKRWHVDPFAGYPYFSLAGRNVPMHRFLMDLSEPRSGGEVHHKNGLKRDNRRRNLHVCANASEHQRVWHGRRKVAA